jgi:hypothetical protein
MSQVSASTTRNLRDLPTAALVKEIGESTDQTVKFPGKVISR